MDENKKEEEFDIPAKYIVGLLLALVLGAFVIGGFRSFAHDAVDLAQSDRRVPRYVYSLFALLVMGILFSLRYYYRHSDR